MSDLAGSVAGGRTDAYRIPDGSPWFHVVNVSGGRSSGYMLRKILDAHGGALPPRCEAVFANTGKEREETLDFVQAMTDRWAVPITWLEFAYDDSAGEGEGSHSRRAATKYRSRVVDHTTASRVGEPFDALLRVSWMPSVRRRTCTQELKVNTIDRHLWQAHGLTKRQTRKVIGFRHDEPARWRPAVYSECQVAYPMVEAGVTREDVAAFWQVQPFDLGIDSARGNCDLCYLKPRRNLVETIREEPARADWWAEVERLRARTFRIGESFAQLKAEALAGALPGGGSGEIGDDRQIPLPCFCTD